MEDRKITLLKAAYELLKKCDEGVYVKNTLEETIYYDNAECDGFCLMEDIAIIAFGTRYPGMHVYIFKQKHSEDELIEQKP